MPRLPIARLGHPILDRQHVRMVELARAFIAAAHRGDGRRELGLLIRATRRHFATEDRLMALGPYPDRAGHEALHRGVMDDILRMRAELAAGRAVHRAVAAQVLEWLAHHTAEADRNLVVHLAARRG